MTDGDRLLSNRFKELSELSYKNSRYYFTDFLSPADVNILHETLGRDEGGIVVLSGGPTHLNNDAGLIAEKNADRQDACQDMQHERVMARFGNSSDMGYEEDFPIKIVKCEPFIEKFADELNHRDFLGALMNLGIRRETLGDIVINGHTGYIFSTEKMADYIVDNLNKVKHTNMRNSITQELPVDAEPKLSRLNLVVSSSRADVIVAGFTKLSRSQTLELFADQKVSINGRVFENNSGNINEGDIISVRGFGKFRFKKIAYHTKKDRISIEIEKYI